MIFSGATGLTTTILIMKNQVSTSMSVSFDVRFRLPPVGLGGGGEHEGRPDLIQRGIEVLTTNALPHLILRPRERDSFQEIRAGFECGVPAPQPRQLGLPMDQREAFLTGQRPSLLNPFPLALSDSLSAEVATIAGLFGRCKSLASLCRSALPEVPLLREPLHLGAE